MPDNAPKCSNPSCTTGSTTLQACGRCRGASYCSRDCQTSDWPSHKAQCKRQNYVLRFHLCPGEVKDPDVVRTLSCPASATFDDLHQALQVAFQWFSTHTYDFVVADQAYREPDSMKGIIDQMRLSSMAQFDPEIAKQLPRQYLLRVVNPSKQMYVDQASAQMRSHPTTVEKKGHTYKLFQYFEDAQYQGKKLVYTYDFGDNWRHQISLEGRAPPTEDFKLVSAQGHYVAEDVGSPTGWERLKKAYRTSTPTKEQKERRHWFEHDCSNGEQEGLAGRENEVDKDLIDLVLGGMRSQGLTNDVRRNPYNGGDTALPDILARARREADAKNAHLPPGWR